MRQADGFTLHVLVVVLALAMAPVAAQAAWLPNGTPISDPGDQADQWPFTMSADGVGGAIFGWENYALHACRTAPGGGVAPGWSADGVLLQAYPHWGFYPLTVGDGNGGAFIVFNAMDCLAHCNLDPTELRAQRVTASGRIAPGWGTSGIAVGSGFGPDPARSQDYGNTVAIPDERGGVIVVWSSRLNRDGHGLVELRAQRVDSTGTLMWGEPGILAHSSTSTAFMQAATPDGRGGAYLVWLDARSPGVFAQHLAATGVPLWKPNGIPVGSAGLTALSRPVAVSDGSRGCIAAWVGVAARDSGVFATRITADGELPWGGAVRVTSAPGLDSLRVAPCRTGGAILAWRDTRRSSGEQVFAQRLGRNGRAAWRRGGVPVCTASGRRDCLALVSDGRDGVYLAWSDSRSAGEVFATHVGDEGNPVRGWGRDGSPVCAAITPVISLQMVPDGAGGAIVAWTDFRRVDPPGTSFTLRTSQAMRLLAHGPATPPPAVGATASLAEVPGSAAAAVPRAEFALRGMQPNPGRLGSAIRFALADATPASLDLLDIAGRRVWSRDVGGMGAGEHSVRIADGAPLPPGIYLARLEQGASRATARVVILR